MGNIHKDAKTGQFVKKNIDEDALVKLYNSGISESEIARKMSLKQQTISKRLRKLGLPTIRAKLLPMTEKKGKWLCERCETYKDKVDFIYTSDGRLRLRFCRQCKHEGSNASVHKTYQSYIRNLIRHTKHRAKNNKLEFDIDSAYCITLWEKQDGKCFYTDAILKIDSSNQTRHNHHSASLDRIVPAKGYTKGNVVWCTQRINVMKNDATIDEMKEYMPKWYEKIMQFLETNHEF